MMAKEPVLVAPRREAMKAVFSTQAEPFQKSVEFVMVPAGTGWPIAGRVSQEVEVPLLESTWPRVPVFPAESRRAK